MIPAQQNASMPAYPVAEAQRDGLNKRELIAAMAMQGLLASGMRSSPNIANDAVVCADALLDLLAHLAKDGAQ